MQKCIIPKWIELLAKFEKPENISRLARRSKITYSYTVKVVNILKDHKLLNFQDISKNKRDKIVYLTSKGKCISRCCRILIEYISQ